jgi:hypothetical protein
VLACPTRRPRAPESEDILNLVVNASLDQCLVAAVTKSETIDHQARLDVIREREKDLAGCPGIPSSGPPAHGVRIRRDRGRTHLRCGPPKHRRDNLALFGNNNQLLRPGIGRIAEWNGSSNPPSLRLQVRPRLRNCVWPSSPFRTPRTRPAHSTSNCRGRPRRALVRRPRSVLRCWPGILERGKRKSEGCVRACRDDERRRDPQRRISLSNPCSAGRSSVAPG